MFKPATIVAISDKLGKIQGNWEELRGPFSVEDFM